MDSNLQASIQSAARHLVTLAIAALGFVITMMFASSGSELLVSITVYKKSIQSALWFFLAAVVLGFLSEAALLGEVLGQKRRIFLSNPLFLLLMAWTSFVFGAAAIVVFALANAYDLPPL